MYWGTIALLNPKFKKKKGLVEITIQLPEILTQGFCFSLTHQYGLIHLRSPNDLWTAGSYYNARCIVALCFFVYKSKHKFKHLFLDGLQRKQHLNTLKNSSLKGLYNGRLEHRCCKHNVLLSEAPVTCHMVGLLVIPWHQGALTDYDQRWSCKLHNGLNYKLAWCRHTEAISMHLARFWDRMKATVYQIQAYWHSW